MNTCIRGSDYAYGGIERAEIHFSKIDSSLSGCGVNLAEELHRLADGGIFCDSREIPYEKLVEMVISGPMLDLRLPSDGSERFSDHGTLARMGPALGGAFQTIAGIALNDRAWTGLDRVGLNVYVRLRREAGARVGIRKGDAMCWEDGEVEEIRPCGCRA